MKTYPPIKSGRPELEGDGFCLGVTSSRRSGGLVVHSHTRDFVDTTKKLLNKLRELGCTGDQRRFSSIQINHNTVVNRHVDGNSDPSIAVSFGDFSGGCLVVDEEVVDIYQNPTVIDGSREHFVTHHEGDRWSLVVFTHGRVTELAEADSEFLTSIGFRIHEDVAPSQNLLDAPFAASECERDCSDTRHKVTVIDFASGHFVGIFAGALMGFDGDSAIITSDTEVMMSIPKMKPIPTNLGTIQAVKAQAVTHFVADRPNAIPFLVANLSKASLAAQGASFDTALEKLHQIFTQVDQYEGSQMSAAIHTYFLDEQGMDACASVFGTMPFEMWNSDFSAVAGKSLWWIRGDVTWPKGTTLEKNMVFRGLSRRNGIGFSKLRRKRSSSHGNL